MTKYVVVQRREKGDDDWRNLPWDEAIKTPEGRLYFEEVIAPSMEAILLNPAWNQAIQSICQLHEATQKAIEKFFAIEPQLTLALNKFQTNFSHLSKIFTPSFSFGSIIDVPLAEEEEVTTSPAPGKVVQQLPRRAEYLCDRIAFWKEEGMILFLSHDGWRVEKISRQSTAIILRLRERAQEADHNGLKAEDLAVISNATSRRNRIKAVLSRIGEIRRLCDTYGSPHIVIHDEITHRWRYNPDLLLSPERFSRMLTEGSQNER